MSREKSLKGWLFAKQGEEAKPQTPLAGVTYRNEQLSKELVEKGWPFKEIVNSEDFNQFLYLLTSVVKHLESQGVLHWSEEVNYERGALVLSDDYYVYQAIKESGPDSVGYKNPQTSPEYWELFTQGGILDPNAKKDFGELYWYKQSQPELRYPIDPEEIEFITEYYPASGFQWNNVNFSNYMKTWHYSIEKNDQGEYRCKKTEEEEKAYIYRTSGLIQQGHTRTYNLISPEGYRYYKGYGPDAGDPKYNEVDVPEYILMDNGKKWKKLMEVGQNYYLSGVGDNYRAANIALDESGYLYCWGQVPFYFSNEVDIKAGDPPTKISELSFVDFVCCPSHRSSEQIYSHPYCYALTGDGKIYSWGGYDKLEDKYFLMQPIEAAGASFRKIYPWEQGVLAIDERGRLWGCGANKSGALCNGTKEDLTEFSLLNESNWKEICICGYDSVIKGNLVLLDSESRPYYCGSAIADLEETTVPIKLLDEPVDFAMVQATDFSYGDAALDEFTATIFIALPSDKKFLGPEDFASLKEAFDGNETGKMISPYLLAQVLNSRFNKSSILGTLKQGVAFEGGNKFLRQDGFNFAMASDVFYSITNDPETDKDIYVTVEEKIRAIQSILDAGGGGGGGGGIVTINGLAAETGSSDILLTSQYVLAGSEFIQGLGELSSGWQHGFTDNQPLSGVLSVSIRRFDSLYNGLNKRVTDLEQTGVVTSQVQSVNGVAPDPDGNIALEAVDIAFNLKDDEGYDIPTSPAISNQNLQQFFADLQYAIFSVNGYSAWENEPGIINGSIDIYGDTMFLESPGSGTPMQDWDGNPLSQKTVYDFAYDVYTHSIKEISTDGGETYSTAKNGKLNLTIQCPASGWVAGEYGAVSGAYISLTDILDQLSRKSIRTINDNAVDDEDTGNIKIYAGDLLMRSKYSEDDYPPTVDEAFSTTDNYKMGSPIYYSDAVQSCEPNTDYQTDDSTGYILLELGVRDGEVPTDPFVVMIGEITVAEIIPAAGTRQTFMFPCPIWVTWRCISPGLPFEIVSIQFVPGEHITY